MINIACILKKNYKNLHIFVSCLLPRDDEKSQKRSLLYTVNCYLKEFCTNQFHYIDLHSGWTLNNHLNTELFSSNNLHLNRKGYKRLSKLFIVKIESLQITLRRQNLKTSRNYTEAVSFSIVDDQFPAPLLSVYRNFSKPVCPVNLCKPLPPINPSKHICSFNFNEPICFVNSCKLVHPVDFSNPMCTVDGLRSVCPVNFSKSVCPVDALKAVHSVNFNKIVCTVNSNKPGCPVNSSTLVRPVNSSNFVDPVDICIVDSNKPLHLVNSSKPVCPVDVRKPIHPVNSKKIICTVNSNQPVNSKTVCPVNSSKPVFPGNSSKPVCPIDVCKSVRPVNSNKRVYSVDLCKSVGSVDVHKPVCPVDICKPFFVDHWRHVSLFLILLFFVVSINTSAFNRTILNMILFINIHVTNLIFTKFFKCTFVILIGYFLYIGDRLFKYLFLGIFIICKHFFKLLLIIFVMNFAFVDILYLKNVSFGVDNVKTINGTYSLTVMAEDFSNYGQEVFISVSVIPENTKLLDYILRNYLILTLISFSIFGKNRVLNFSKLFISIFVMFLCFCKAPNNSIDSDLKSCSKFTFYSSESIKLQENLNNVNRNTSLA